MSPREHLLRALFRLLDQGAVPYCVLRNYANIYENNLSDIDVAVEPEYVPQFKDCLAEAAKATGHHLVLRARYVNYSYVYRDPEGGFIRIDIETEVRWHVFPVLTAKSIIGLRRRYGDFFIPHPRHESAILWVAAIWRGELSERYSKQLASLYQQVPNPRELQRTFSASFGTVGQELVACQSDILGRSFDRRFWKTARRSIVRNAFRDQPSRSALLTHFSSDLTRLWERALQPRGISIVYASVAKSGRDIQDFFRQLKLLYPIEKSDIHAFEFSPTQRKPVKTLGVRMRIRRLIVLFKGGLFMRFYRCWHDYEIPVALETHSRYLFPSRTFVWSEDSRLNVWLGHIETGFMAEVISSSTDQVSNDQVIRFISDVLEHYPARNERRPRRRGAFVVLLGADAAASRAVSRSLCCLAMEQNRFYRIRYSRWPARLGRKRVFPARDNDSQEIPPPATQNTDSTFLPIPRFFRIFLRDYPAYWMRFRPLVRRNSLILFDGYDSNFLSDSGAAESSSRARLLSRFLSPYPQPDLLVLLKTAEAVSRSNQPAAQEAEDFNETSASGQPRLDPRRTLQANATASPEEIAREIFQKLSAIVP